MGKTVNFDECRLQMERPLKSINLSEDSDDDSDQRQLFELPKRKVKRPSTSVFKKKIGSSKKLSCCGRTSLCCKVCFSTLVPIFVATFVAFTVIFFIVLTMGMSGINKELEGLKIRVSYAEGAEKDFNSKRDKLRKDFEDKLSQLDNEKKKVQIYKDQINILQSQVRSLNSSIQDIRKQPVFDVNSVKSDLDKIKTGMADIGSSISKLENNHIALEKRVSTLSAKTHKIQNILTNVTSDMNNGNRAIPSLRSTTVKPFVVTLTPNENSVVKFKQFKRAIAEVEEKQKDLCQTQSEQFWKEISNLKNRTTLLNETYLKKFENLKTLLNEKDAIATKAPSTDSLKATPSPSPTTTTTTKKPTTFHSSSETTLQNTENDSPKNDLDTIDSLAQDLDKRRRSIYKKRNV